MENNAEHLKPYQFQPGKSGNPRGRPRTVSSKTMQTFLSHISKGKINALREKLVNEVKEGDMKAASTLAYLDSLIPKNLKIDLTINTLADAHAVQNNILAKVSNGTFTPAFAKTLMSLTQMRADLMLRQATAEDRGYSDDLHRLDFSSDRGSRAPTDSPAEHA